MVTHIYTCMMHIHYFAMFRNFSVEYYQEFRLGVYKFSKLVHLFAGNQFVCYNVFGIGKIYRFTLIKANISRGLTTFNDIDPKLLYTLQWNISKTYMLLLMTITCTWTPVNVSHMHKFQWSLLHLHSPFVMLISWALNF